jgi:hypothetical protein
MDSPTKLLRWQMSGIFKDDMTYQLARAISFDAVEYHGYISALQNSSVSYLPPCNVGEDNSEDGNNASGECRNHFMVRFDLVSKQIPVSQDLMHGVILTSGRSRRTLRQPPPHRCGQLVAVTFAREKVPINIKRHRDGGVA